VPVFNLVFGIIDMQVTGCVLRYFGPMGVETEKDLVLRVHKMKFEDSLDFSGSFSLVKIRKLQALARLKHDAITPSDQTPMRKTSARNLRTILGMLLDVVAGAQQILDFFEVRLYIQTCTAKKKSPSLTRALQNHYFLLAREGQNYPLGLIPT
jgi:hypothetical protein